MGILNLFAKPSVAAKPETLPQGSFSMDSSGRIVSSTLPQTFPEERMRQIGQIMITVFRSAQERQLPLRELSVQYAGLSLTAREMRGGTMVFFSPRKMSRSNP
jgi:hypothetical protein